METVEHNIDMTSCNELTKSRKGAQSRSSRMVKLLNKHLVKNAMTRLKQSILFSYGQTQASYSFIYVLFNQRKYMPSQSVVSYNSLYVGFKLGKQSML